MSKAPMKWSYLDRLKTANGIARALGRAGVKGVMNTCMDCPLAKATGSEVNYDHRVDEWGDFETLTDAEMEFVKKFDEGDYPDLVEYAAEVPLE